MAVVEVSTSSKPTSVEQFTVQSQEIPVHAPQAIEPPVIKEEVKAVAEEQESYKQEAIQPMNETPPSNVANAPEAPELFEVEPMAASVEKKVSALSLSSIRARKEMESSLEKKVVNPDDLPKEPFTADQFMAEWNKYAEKLARSGFMLMSSLMGMVPPVIQGTSVSLEMPNEGSKLSFDENKFDLVNYLRKKLNNFDLEIEITVNEEVKIQKRVLDKEDKLVRFIELNPAMQYMKEIFDLEFKY